MATPPSCFKRGEPDLHLPFDTALAWILKAESDVISPPAPNVEGTCGDDSNCGGGPGPMRPASQSFHKT